MATTSRREKILETARNLFVKQGYDGTAVGDIAKSLDISKASVTYHFPAKADFLGALAAPLLDALEVVLSEFPEPAWPGQVRDLLDEYFGVLLANAGVARWIDTDPALRSSSDLPGTQLRVINQELVDRMVWESDDEVDRMRALAVIGGIWRPLHSEPVDDVISHRAEIVEAALMSYRDLNEYD